MNSKNHLFPLLVVVLTGPWSKLHAQSCVQSTPYVENFDGSTFVLPPTVLDTGQLDACWSRTNVTNYFWSPYTGPSVTFNSGPNNDHTSGIGNYLLAREQFSVIIVTPAQTNLKTPLIDLSGLTQPQFSFWYHMYGAGIDSLRVLVRRGTSDSLLHTFVGQQQLSSADLWKEYIVALPGLAGDTVQFKFTAHAGGQAADIAIDDIQVIERPTCPKPQGLTSSSIGHDSVVLNWNSGGATQWQIEYGPSGFTPGMGTLVNVSSNPYTLRNLQSNTSYDIYVRDSCGLGSTSQWSGPASISTLCGVATIPYSQDFDGNDFAHALSYFDPGTLNICWGRAPTGVFHWRIGKNQTTNLFSGPSGDHTSGNGRYAHCDDISGSTNLTTNIKVEKISLAGATAPELRFWYHMYGNDIHSLRTQIRREGTTTWIPLDTIVGAQHVSAATPWTERIIDLSAFINDTIVIRFVGQRSTVTIASMADMAIDDIFVGEAPTCNTKPSGLTVSSTSLNSVTLSWTNSPTTSWQVSYRPLGLGGQRTIVNATTNPFTVTGLNHSSRYEFWVRDSCGLADVGVWEGAVVGQTDCGALTLPYHEDFNGLAWTSGTNWNNAGDAIDPCWSRNPGGGTGIAAFWGTRSGGTNTFSSGPVGDVGLSGKYIYSEAGSMPGLSDISTPEIYLDPIITKDPKLFFYYHMYGSGIQSLTIQVNDGTGWSGNLYTKTGQQHFSNSAAWTQDSLDLTVYSGDTIRIRFTGLSNGFSGDIALDEVEVKGVPAVCDSVTAQFSHSNNFLKVDFDGALSQNADSLVWDFGDGNLDTAFSQIQHIYSTPGLYTLTLYAYNYCGSGDTLQQQVRVCDSLHADYSFTAFGDSLYLDANNSLGSHGYVWSVDGRFLDSSGVATSFVADSAGFYDINLLVFNLCGDTTSIVKNIQICEAPEARWSFTIVSTTSAGMLAQFDASPSSNAVSYAWDFGDGNTGQGQTPLNLYTVPGLHYNVTLTVTNDCGEDHLLSSRLDHISLPQLDVESAIEVYPNPATDILNIVVRHHQAHLKSIRIRTITGELILDHAWQKNNTEDQLKLDGIAAGVYLLEIETPSDSYYQKLVIE